jgi:hypothetical protein
MLVPFASIVFLSMDTAKDRENYIRFFSDPFAPVRWEEGFVLMGRAMSFVFSPEMSIVAVSSISYLSLAFSWQKIYPNGAIASFLSFHLSAYMLFNYFLGTAIRNGFAAGLIIFIFTLVVKRRSFFASMFLFAGPAFHLGASLFSLIGWIFTHMHRFRIAMAVGLGASTIAIFVFLFVLPSYISSSYYLIYLEAGETSERFRSFSMLLYALCVVLLLIQPDKDVWSRVSLLPIPLLIFYLISGFEVLARLLTPFFFIAIASTFREYNSRIIRSLGGNFLGLFLVVGNVFGLVYAFRQWGLF